MKFTKFIPVALMLTLAIPAYAADPAPTASETAQSDMVITVPNFINITKKAGGLETATASFDATYSNITLDGAMNATFNVVTNKPGDNVYLSAEAVEAGVVNKKALGGDSATALKIVFTREGSGEEGANSGAVANALGSATIADNMNAIAFAITPTLTPDTTSGAVAPNASLSNNVVTYTVIVSVDNNDGILVPGMTANVEIVTSKKENVLTVPNIALKFTPETNKQKFEKQGIWVLHKGKLERIEIFSKTLERNYNLYEQSISFRAKQSVIYRLPSAAVNLS